MTHKIPAKEIIKQIKKHDPKVTSLQTPEGLKRKTHKLARKIEEKTDTTVFISGNPCYGACDIEDRELSRVDVDLIIHLGHTEIPIETETPVLYFEIPMELEIDKLVQKAVEKIGNSKVGLLTTAQHHSAIPTIKQKLQKEDIQTVVGEGDRSIKHPGQVLGCNFTAAEIPVDKYLFVGTGNFHPMGIAYSTGKPVLILDPEMNQLREIQDADKFIKKRYAAIAKAQDADKFGVLLCTKPGQLRKNLAIKTKERLAESGLESTIITIDEVTPERLLQLDYDAYVNTGCPRITYDDQTRYRKPILSPTEAKIITGDSQELEYDEIRRK
ncbi:MAG: diphthamide biosynthesis enzyme Dph2 [Methanonatronarchaeia archaeon]|nr:MAG: diphthamide biosynthesis enzyme Dph2 [Methanonatronarchaeia archaeon]